MLELVVGLNKAQPRIKGIFCEYRNESHMRARALEKALEEFASQLSQIQSQIQKLQNFMDLKGKENVSAPFLQLLSDCKETETKIKSDIQNRQTELLEKYMQQMVVAQHQAVTFEY